MGPIEAELRKCPSLSNGAIMNWVWSGDRPDRLFDTVVAACIQLGISPDPHGYTHSALKAKALPDVISEAIEAAEALGL